jgi:universal stress protein A
MKILLALDTSALAEETTAAIPRMFAPSEASVVVLSVVGVNESQTIPSQVLQASVAQDVAVLEAGLVRTHEVVAARAAQALRDAGFQATSEIAHGDPRHALVAAVRSHAADVLVVGSHGHSFPRRLVMGSVATHAIEHAPCDVLIVRHAGAVRG